MIRKVLFGLGLVILTSQANLLAAASTPSAAAVAPTNCKICFDDGIGSGLYCLDGMAEGYYYCAFSWDVCTAWSSCSIVGLNELGPEGTAGGAIPVDAGLKQLRPGTTVAVRCGDMIAAFSYEVAEQALLRSELGLIAL